MEDAGYVFRPMLFFFFTSPSRLLDNLGAYLVLSASNHDSMTAAGSLQRSVWGSTVVDVAIGSKPGGG